MDIIGGQHLRQMWDDLADVYGHKTALICESSGGVVNRYSYLELNQEINRTANLFYTLGIRKGDKVALHLDNCPEFIFCWFGLAKIGAIMVPINARLLREESAWILQNSQACLLVTSAQFYPMYQQIQQEDATQLRHICLTDVALPADDGVSSFTQLKNQQPATLCYAPPLSTDDTAEILFTSGTTSRPKGVVITHYNLRFAGYYSAWQCALRDDDVYLTVMPAFHIDCQCTAAMAAFSAGATFVLVEKYSARAFWGQVQKYRATITECIPMMIRTLMVQPPSANDRQHRLREVMFYLNLSEQEKDAFCERFGVRLLTSYGMTETIVGIIGDRPGDKRRWPSIGRAGFCYEAEIRDDHNRPLPAGEIGEICIKGVPGKTIFKEYFLNPKATAKVLEADGWLHTGDTGYCDEEGFFYFVDRRCNMIKRGGENVSCVELENIIATHPKIQDIVVVGIKDSIRDEAIKAFVVLNEGETLSEEEFFRFCEQNMAKFKVPSYLEIRKDLPRNCSGKIIRKNLKKMKQQGTTLPANNHAIKQYAFFAGMLSSLKKQKWRKGMSESLHLTRNGSILEITLDRPKANAIDAKTSFEMGEVFLNFRDDPQLRVAIITGAGEKFFSAGWDLKAAAEGEAPDADFGPGGFAGLTEIFNLDKPVIAAVNGYAFGGGFELALAADFIVCADNASFALPEAKLGIVPDSGGVLRLPKILPPAIVNEMVMTGRRMGTEEALRWGIVNRVVSQAELMDNARELAQQLVNSAPLAIAALKEIYRTTSEMPVEEAYRYIRSGVLKHYPSVLHSEDAVEGPLAFAEKRDPVWKGR